MVVYYVPMVRCRGVHPWNRGLEIIGREPKGHADVCMQTTRLSFAVHTFIDTHVKPKSTHLVHAFYKFCHREIDLKFRSISPKAGQSTSIAAQSPAPFLDVGMHARCSFLDVGMHATVARLAFGSSVSVWGDVPILD